MTKLEALQEYAARQTRCRIKPRILKRLMRWNPQETITRNAKVFQISYSVAYDFCRKYNLESLWRWPRQHVQRDQTIRQLRLNEWTLASIGKRYGMSRQCVHMIVKPETP